jgi:alkylation response protein AidB-like acyl-CoA dehydrogenase
MVLDQEHLMVHAALRNFARDAITPHAAAWDRERTFPRDVRVCQIYERTNDIQKTFDRARSWLKK